MHMVIWSPQAEMDCPSTNIFRRTDTGPCMEVTIEDTALMSITAEQGKADVVKYLRYRVASLVIPSRNDIVPFELAERTGNIDISRQ